jgi:hypothetical protein
MKTDDKGSETRLDSLLFDIEVSDEYFPVFLHLYIVIDCGFALRYIASSISSSMLELVECRLTKAA